MRQKFVEKSYCKKNPQSAIFLHKTYLFPPLPFFNFYFSNKSTNSLSKCLNYPGFIFLCLRKLSKHYPRKKKQSPWTIQILSQNFWQNLVKKTNNWNYPRKKTNTLNYPNTIRYFRDLAKFSRIFHENKIFYNMCFFCKNLAMFNFVL